jgi:hypothetical protein
LATEKPGELDNAHRTIAKCEDTLRQCLTFFARQAEMNAATHMSARVMYSPLHSAIEATLKGITVFNETYEP